MGGGPTSLSLCTVIEWSTNEYNRPNSNILKDQTGLNTKFITEIPDQQNEINSLYRLNAVHFCDDASQKGRDIRKRYHVCFI